MSKSLQLPFHLMLAGLLSWTLSIPLAAQTCEQAYQDQLATDLALDYTAFDQTAGQGFRKLAGLGCKQQAADLIEAYIEANNATQSSLRWHIAQLRASHGANDEAIRYARTVLNEEEDLEARPLRWNDYVLATIAFLEKDKAALQYHRDQVAAGADDHFGNQLNLKLLDALIKHFDHSYAYATARIE